MQMASVFWVPLCGHVCVPAAGQPWSRGGCAVTGTPWGRSCEKTHRTSEYVIYQQGVSEQQDRRSQFHQNWTGDVAIMDFQNVTF